MNIAIIGTGNVATIFCRLFSQHEHRIVQVLGRDEQKVSALAASCGAHSSSWASGVIDPVVELCIVAVNDDALKEVLTKVDFNNKPIAHTAGSLSMQLLKGFAHNYGIFYPLQTLRKEMTDLPPIPFLIDGSDDEMIQLLRSLAISVSDRVEVANDEKRGRLHVAAVTVCNFTNHLFSLAEQYCHKEELPFDILFPLILQTAKGIVPKGPAAVQTGPAIRKDLATIERHLQWLNAHPELKSIYLMLSESIMEFTDKDK